MELTPKTRKEVFLAAAGGQDVTTPTPITREEAFLDAIAKSGGGGGGSSGGGVLEISIDNDTGALNKTWQEIHDALLSGKTCKVMEEYGGNVSLHIVTDVYISSSPGGAITYGVSSSGLYAYTDSANGYPVLG